MSRPFTVGIHIDGPGSHPAALGDVGGGAERVLGPDRVRETIARVEAAGFSYATFAGSHLPPQTSPELPARLDPVQQAAFAGPLSSRIGLIPEIPVSYVEPFHTATQLASIDYASVGRAGWLVSAENSPEAARQFGREALDDEVLAAELADAVAVVRRLWDSWEADAVIRELSTGRYIDREKLHYIDFVGRTFSVKGPSITPRPPQGQLPVIVPVAHAAGVDADAVIVSAGTGLAERVAAARELGVAIVIVDLEVVLDSRGERAADRLARLDADRPWPGAAAERFLGTAAELTGLIGELAETVDGVRILPASLDRDLDELRFAVLPALTAAGVHEPPRPGTSLRQALGLPAAENIYAAFGRN